MSLKGGPELRSRLKAIKGFFKPFGKAWATDFRDHAQREVPSRTGRLRRSIRVRNASQRKATVVAHYTAYMVDAGVKAHEIKPKRAKMLRFQVGQGQIVFAKRVRHPGYRPRPFRQRLAEQALRRQPMLETLIAEWNKAGGRTRFTR